MRKTYQPDALEAGRRIAERHYPVHTLGAVAALIAGLSGGAAHAATTIVTNKNDAGPGSLRALVAQANLNPGPDTIQFDPKVKGIITLKTGEININTGPLTIQGPGAHLLSISGNDASRIFSINSGAPTTIRGLKLTKGRTTGGGEGGGAIASFATLTLEDSVVSGSTIAGTNSYGGGVYALNSSVTLTNSTISGNSTTGSNGIGGGLMVRIGNATLTNSTVSGNSTAAGFGGGLAVTLGDAVLMDSTVSGNSTTGNNGTGGGLAVSVGNATLTNSTISGNSTAGSQSYGGGLFVASGSATLTNSTVSGNSTAGLQSHGGGLIVLTGVAITLTNSTVSGNSTSGQGALGGGLYLSGPATLTNSTVSGNSVTGINGSGGGLFVYNTPITLTNTTFALNTATSGADGANVHPNSNFTANNSIIAQGDAGDVACASTIDSGSNNLVSGTGCGGLATPVQLSVLNLGGLADNGGPTKTHALLAGSPAINAGDVADCAGAPPGPNNQDQRGVSRLISGACDIGAYERNLNDPSLACPLTPDTSCANLATASLTVKRGKTPSLSFGAAGDTTGDANLFGNPTANTSNLLCVYTTGGILDAQARVLSPLSSLLWKFNPVKGTATYSEKVGFLEGVTSIKQTPGVKGKLSWTMKGDATLDVRLPATPPVLVQNQNSDGGCAQSEFNSAEHFKKNDSTTLMLKRKP